LPDGFHRYEFGKHVYEGYWKNGLPNGEGTLTVFEEAVTIITKGTYVNAAPHGKITHLFNWSDGTVCTWNFDVNMGKATKEATLKCNNKDHCSLIIGPQYDLIGIVPPWWLD